MAPNSRNPDSNVRPSHMTEQGRRMSRILEVSNEFNLRDVSGRGSGFHSGSFHERRISNDLAQMGSDAFDDASLSSRENSTAGSDANLTAEKVTPEIAARENANVRYAKILVLAVLLAAAGAVGFLTYWYITEAENDDYKQQFQTDAKELIDISNANGRNIMAVLSIFSTLLSSTAIQSNATWPFYTLPDFEKFGLGSRELSGALMLAFAPRVNAEERAEWEEYSVENQWWIREGLDDLGITRRVRNVTDFIYRKTTRSFVPELDFDSYNPVWQISPAPTDTSVINFNLFNHPTFKRLVEFSDFTREAAISEVLDTFLVFGTSAPQKGDDPQSLAVLPVFEIPGDKTSEIVGHVVAVIPWGQFFTNILQEGHDGVYAVLEESCGSSFTYIINGAEAEFLGTQDLHDTKYNKEGQSTQFVAYSGDLTGLEGRNDHCEYTITVYPSQVYEEDYESNEPILFTIVVVLVFGFTSSIFILYDWCVTQRQRKVNQVAVQSSAIVTSLFPAQVRDKLFQMDDGKDKKTEKKKFQRKGKISSAAAAAGFDMDESESHLPTEEGPDDSAPIADLFPSATVLFMDIAGFTSWSSTREPSQVFTLLETIYKNFDRIAKKRKVFKVETIGDCYVAVCGLPEPCDDHAVVMARFARDCLEKMGSLVQELESNLGPDTADLIMRVGIHSGPVTAGVLRGDRARFQLFGDTVNTASRMESTGVKAKIQISQETAELIAAAGKSGWIVPREDRVTAKGKGELKTFWLLPRGGVTKSQYTASVSGDTDLQTSFSVASEDEEDTASNAAKVVSSDEARTRRLVDYSSDLLLKILNKILSKRGSRVPTVAESNRVKELERDLGQSTIALEEVKEVIELPAFDSSAYGNTDVEAPEEVREQLNNYVMKVAGMYCSNPFHNFDHASHVTQSVNKLLSRIVAVKELEDAKELHDRTYGITSDPLTQFAILFSSLIHDVDHRGVPNALLMKEHPELASLYKSQAVAEQNSVDVAWNLLMDPAFEKLRRAIYCDESELQRFRELVVNSIMATDIFDKKLAGLRKERWEKAFSQEIVEHPQVAINRKATIVIEHIIQASDVSHTMQHWYVYSKWNEKLFHEMLKAYHDGRSDSDPSSGWYKGELWFFDNYVIPLAKKLKECGVFGVSSDEYLQYAVANRREWETKGETIVKENIAKFSAKNGTNSL